MAVGVEIEELTPTYTLLPYQLDDRPGRRHRRTPIVAAGKKNIVTVAITFIDWLSAFIVWLSCWLTVLNACSRMRTVRYVARNNSRGWSYFGLCCPNFGLAVCSFLGALAYVGSKLVPLQPFPSLYLVCLPEEGYGALPQPGMQPNMPHPSFPSRVRHALLCYTWRRNQRTRRWLRFRRSRGPSI